MMSLDAPAVAVLWQAILGRTASEPARPAEAFVLGSSVWLAYCGDRWLEAWRLEPGKILTHRHRFHLEHRWALALAWVAVLAADLAAAFGGLSRRQIRWGLILLALVVTYLFSHQLIHRRTAWRIPKEFCVAFLFSAGASLFAAARSADALVLMAVPLALFALLCLSNCSLIAFWEHDVDASHGETSISHQLGGISALVRFGPWIVAAAAAAALALVPPAERAATACAALAGVLLGLVDLGQGRMGRANSRVLADVALMTPAAWLALGLLK
ncbi:MAG TPA: hypothetical protein VGG37_02560 [Opitutaceae bacterium]|jgi:hypothetical protein